MSRVRTERGPPLRPRSTCACAGEAAETVAAADAEARVAASNAAVASMQAMLLEGRQAMQRRLEAERERVVAQVRGSRRCTLRTPLVQDVATAGTSQQLAVQSDGCTVHVVAVQMRGDMASAEARMRAENAAVASKLERTEDKVAAIHAEKDEVRA